MVGHRSGQNDAGGSLGLVNSGVDLGLEVDEEGCSRDITWEVASIKQAGGRKVEKGVWVAGAQVQGRLV